MKTIFNILFALLFGSIGTFIIGTSLGVSVFEAIGIVVTLEFLMYFVSLNLGRNLSFALVCGEISASLTADCSTPVQQGTQDTIWLINWGDVASWSDNLTNVMITENITLALGKTAYTLTGYNNSNMPTYTMIDGAFVKKWDHNLNCKVFDVSPTAKQNLEGMKDGLFVVVVENLNKGANGENAFEIYGRDAGLKITGITRDPNSADTQGAFDITFGTPKNKENYMPRTLFDTDYATTLAILNGLV